MQAVGSDGLNSRVENHSFGGYAAFTGVRADGTSASPTALAAGDCISSFSARGYAASGYSSASAGDIRIFANSSWATAGNQDTYMIFETTSTGSVTVAERMRVTAAGNLLVGTTTDNGVDKIQTPGGVNSAYVKLAGSTSGTAELTVPATISTYILSLPAAQGAASSYLQNDGSGNLSWVTSGAPPTVTSNIDGGSSSTLYTSPQIVSGGTA
jgi:hypothetical protein